MEYRAMLEKYGAMPFGYYALRADGLRGGAPRGNFAEPHSLECGKTHAVYRKAHTHHSNSGDAVESHADGMCCTVIVKYCDQSRAQ
jgi:hypothetical protein